LGSYCDPTEQARRADTIIGILLGSYWDPIGILLSKRSGRTLLGFDWDPTEQVQRVETIGILLGSYWDLIGILLYVLAPY